MRYLSFKFDDGFLCGAEQAASILQDLPASFFLIGELLEDGPLAFSEPLFRGREFGDKERWRALVAKGHELQPHSYSHRPYDDMTDQERRTDLRLSVQTVREIAGKASVFGFPFNRLAPISADGLGLIASGFDTKTSSADPHYHDLSKDVDLRRLKSWAVRERDLETIKTSLGKVPENSWLVLTFHSFGDEGHEPWTSNKFRQLVDLVRAQKFSVRTVGDMAFMLERGQAARRQELATAQLRAEDGNQYFIAPVEAGFSTFSFLVNNPVDHIQAHHVRGEVYEKEELELICELAPNGKRFLDIGANVGNHSIYLAHRLDLDRVTPIEVQPGVLDLLKSNIGLNWHRAFDLSHLGLGLGRSTGYAEIEKFSLNNLGGTSLREVHNPTDSGISDPRRDSVFRIEAGDNLFAPHDFDIVKVDVEGMELDVMRGMESFFLNYKGLLFVEVRDDNVGECAEYFEHHGWVIVSEYRRYQLCSNWYLKKG